MSLLLCAQHSHLLEVSILPREWKDTWSWARALHSGSSTSDWNDSLREICAVKNLIPLNAVGMESRKGLFMKVNQRLKAFGGFYDAFCAGECPGSLPYEYWKCLMPYCYCAKITSLVCPVLRSRSMCRSSECSKIFWLRHWNSIFECRINITLWEHRVFS